MTDRDFPWHSLGVKLVDARTAEQAVQQAGLNWSVVEREVRVPGVPSQRVLVREDLWDGKSNGVLGEVRANYEPLQNIDAFTLFDPIVKRGVASYDSAGALHEGKWVWLLLRWHEDPEILPNDRIARFLLFGHTPSNGYHRTSFICGRTICKNTLTEGFFHNPAPAITPVTPGPRQFQVTIDAALQDIHGHFESMLGRFRSLTNISVDDRRLRNYLDTVFEDRRATNRKQLSTEPEKDQEACRHLFAEGTGNDLPGAKGTLWAAYSAVVEYVDFHKLDREDPGYLYDVWSSDLKATALTVATEMAASH